VPKQLTFDLPAKAALGRSDFFVAPSNAAAVTLLESWSDWPGGKLVLCGATGAGKTHLAHVWAALSGAKVVAAAAVDGPLDGPVAVDGLEAITGDRRAEEALFHLHNHVLGQDQPLLVTSALEPARLDFALPDLKSRMLGTTLVRIEPPDDQLMAAVMAKLFADRQLVISPSVVTYAVPRLKRTLAAVHALVEALDLRALERGKPVTRALVAELLDSSGASPDDMS
jgi:chromosomal replication initiation ATPase DnaA